MADLVIEAHGSLTGATEKTVLAAPASGKQRILPANGLSVYNADTAARDIIFIKNTGGSRSTFWKESAVAAGTHVVLPKKVHLTATNMSLEVKTDAGAATTEPTFDTAALETS
jgi:hypothetical protein